MQIFVAGGSGRVATELIKDLVADGHTVIAGARHEDHVIKLDNVKAVHMDLHASVDDLAELIKVATSFTLQLVHVVRICFKQMHLVL